MLGLHDFCGQNETKLFVEGITSVFFIMN